MTREYMIHFERSGEYKIACTSNERREMLKNGGKDVTGQTKHILGWIEQVKRGDRS